MCVGGEDGGSHSVCVCACVRVWGGGGGGGGAKEDRGEECKYRDRSNQPIKTTRLPLGTSQPPPTLPFFLLSCNWPADLSEFKVMVAAVPHTSDRALCSDLHNCVLIK